jgi:hypothetical protein
VISSRRSRVRWTVSDIVGRAAFLGGVACAVLVSRSPWWAAGAVPLLALGVWLTIVGIRAQRDFVADEALEAAAEYDRTHPSGGPSNGASERSR